MSTTTMPQPTPRVLAPAPAAHAAILAMLDTWVDAGWIRALEREWAGFVSQAAPQADPCVILAAALVSHQLGRGHVCLDLAAARQAPDEVLALPPEGLHDPALTRPEQALSLLGEGEWLDALRACPALVADDDGAAAEGAPLVLSGTRLYLRRYWRYEQQLRQSLDERLHAGHGDAAVPQATLARGLDILFAAQPQAPLDWQKLACALAVRSRVSIITGGPGTGKTTTVVRLLALLQHLALGDDAQARPLRIRLAAPTGKAAARLSESIRSAIARLPLQALPQAERLGRAVPSEVTTVHRLLGRRPDTRQLRHDARHPLPLDVLVIDEASMLDLEMMAAVIAALPASARLVLLGDKDQLASVEAGSVLGDLCQRADQAHYRPETAAWLQAVTGQRLDDGWLDPNGQPLDQAIAMLRVSHRFGADSGIGRLAQAVNAGDVPAVRAVWASNAPDLQRTTVAQDAPWRRLILGDPQAGVPGYRDYLQTLRQRRPAPGAVPLDYSSWAREVLQAQGRFQLLCALRTGPAGVDGLNQRVLSLLRAEGLLGPEQGGWMEGLAVLVTRNDPALGLMNGDVGVVLSVPVEHTGGAPVQGLRVAFAASDAPQGVRWVLPSRLRSVETVFAMTVHKSQGSEFTHAALVLPSNASPVLTRELLYTGITRSRERFTLALLDPASGVFEEAIRRRVRRASGWAQG